MRVASKLLLAALALGAFSTTASAAVVLDHSTGLSLSPGPAAGETMVWNFDGIADSRFSYTGNIFSGTVPNIAAEPAGDTSNFGAAEPGYAGQAFTDATFSLVQPGLELTSLSFDLGSLDSYNTISFYDGSTLVQSFNGDMLTDPNPADGNQASNETNRRYYFTFGAADDINKIVFSSSQPAFEFDNIAATVISAVPEPATWAMMIIGFGFVGFMMRSNRQKTAVATV